MDGSPASTSAVSRNREWEPGAGAATGFCEEKQRLLIEFLDAVHELIALQTAQTHSVIRGDPDFLRFDVSLHFAQERKERAKYAWIAHVEEHGCHEGGVEGWGSAKWSVNEFPIAG